MNETPLRKTMKILYVVSGVNMAGGATKSFLAMLDEAAKAGIEFEVMAPEADGVAEYLKGKGVKVHVEPYRRCVLPQLDRPIDVAKWMPRLINNYLINRKATKRLLKEAEAFHPDIIHDNSSAVNIGYRLAKRLHVPYVMHVREYGWKDFRLCIPDFRKRINDTSTYVVAITKDLMRSRNLDSHPHSIQLYNGIIDESGIIYSEEKEEFFLYAGRVTEKKGAGMLLNAYIAYALASPRPLGLKIAGKVVEPAYEAELRKKVADAGLEAMIEWLGEIEDVGSLYARAAATVVPSLNEGLGRVLPEAMAKGCLCIGRYSGGTREQIDNGKILTGNDIALPYETAEELTAILARIEISVRKGDDFKKDGIYFDMIKRSQQAVGNFFSRRKFGEKLIAFYNKILEDSTTS